MIKIMVTCCVAVGVATGAWAGEKNPATDWMAEAKVGAFTHFLPGADNFNLVEKFDVQAVVTFNPGVSLKRWTDKALFTNANETFSRLSRKRAGRPFRWRVP